MDRKVTISRRTCTPFGSKWEIESHRCDILVDGIHVGYCTPQNTPGEIRIFDETLPPDGIEAVKLAVEEYYQQPIEDNKIGIALPIESQQEDEELDG